MFCAAFFLFAYSLHFCLIFSSFFASKHMASAHSIINSTFTITTLLCNNHRISENSGKKKQNENGQKKEALKGKRSFMWLRNELAKKKTDPKTPAAVSFFVLRWNFGTISTKRNYFISFWLMHKIQHFFPLSLYVCVRKFLTEKTVLRNSLDVIITNGRPWKMSDKASRTKDKHPLWIASGRNGNVYNMRYIHFWNFSSAFARSSVASLVRWCIYWRCKSVLCTCCYFVFFRLHSSTFWLSYDCYFDGFLQFCSAKNLFITFHM